MKKDPSYMKTSFKILLFVDGIVLLAGAMLGPIYALFVERIGGDLLTASTTFAVFSLVAGIVIFFIGKFEDLIKEQELAVVVGYMITGVAYFGYIFVQSPTHLFLIQGLLGLGIAIERPAMDALLSKHLERKKAASYWGAWEGMYEMTLGVGALIGGFIASFFGFSTLFILMSGLCIGTALYIFLLPRKVL